MSERNVFFEVNPTKSSWKKISPSIKSHYVIADVSNAIDCRKGLSIGTDISKIGRKL